MKKYALNLYECDKVIFARLRKDLGFYQTGNFGFCTINKNSMNALLPCCEKICPLNLKVSNLKVFDGKRMEVENVR